MAIQPQLIRPSSFQVASQLARQLTIRHRRVVSMRRDGDVWLIPKAVWSVDLEGAGSMLSGQGL